jgi:acetyl esterase/lipase
MNIGASLILSAVIFSAQTSIFAETPERGKEFPIWPGAAPGSENADFKEKIIERSTDPAKHDRVYVNVVTPTLRAFFPGKPNGTSAVIIPGGSYQRIVIDKESEDIAGWLNGIGVTAFILKYRLPVNEHANRSDVMFLDAQRAVRFVRSKAAEWNLSANAVGVIGFSAGGQCAAAVAILHSRKVHENIDDIDTLSARPDYLICGYGNIPDHRRKPDSIDRLNGIPGAIWKYDMLDRIGKTAPPAFIFHADDDLVCPSMNSIDLYTAYRNSNASAELHIFKSGGHGFGIRDAKDSASEWPALCAKWMRFQGLLR